jgi:predicted DNA-binding protein (UPF0251 family)
MVRPQKNRLVDIDPRASYFKPRGIPMMDLEQVQLPLDGLEALRLADYLGLSQQEAGKQMGVSRATFGRIVERARKAVADALIHGKAINVEGGNYTKVDATAKRLFVCDVCSHQWEEMPATGRPKACPACRAETLHRVLKDVRLKAGHCKQP